ncbi:DNA-directed RNA polymerase, partial [Sarracenia purpurea var. burkii]
DTFLTHTQFNQLLYGSGVFSFGCGSSFTKHSGKICTVDSEALMQPLYGNQSHYGQGNG